MEGVEKRKKSPFPVILANARTQENHEKNWVLAFARMTEVGSGLHQKEFFNILHGTTWEVAGTKPA